MKDAISIHIGLNGVNPNHYGSERRLLGCRKDAEAMARIAENAGFSKRTLLRDTDASATHVREAVHAAVRDLSPTGFFLLTYAGHGTRLPDAESAEPGSIVDEEADGHDAAFCLYDRMMRDDELYGLLAGFGTEQRVLLVLDCCHSAGMLPLLVKIRAFAARVASLAGFAGFASAIRGIDEEDALAVRDRHPEVYGPVKDLQVARRSSLKATVLMLAACGEKQTTPDGPENGVFTRALLHSLEPVPRDYDELHKRVGNLHPARTPVLRPRNERTLKFRKMRPFQIHAGAPPAPPSPPGPV